MPANTPRWSWVNPKIKLGGIADRVNGSHSYVTGLESPWEYHFLMAQDLYIHPSEVRTADRVGFDVRHIDFHDLSDAFRFRAGK